MTELPCVSWRSETAWTEVLASLSIYPRARFHRSVYDPTIRTYLHSDSAHKVSLKTGLPELHPRLSPGTSEADLLRHCNGIAGVPSVRGFRETACASVLSMNRVHGRTLQEVIGRLTVVEAVGVAARLLWTTLAVSWRGVAHNDIVPRNIIVSNDGRPYLVDFDQAHHAGRVDALLRNVLGRRTDRRPLYGSWLRVVARLALHLLPRRRAVDMPALAADASPRQRKLLDAWTSARRAAVKAGRGTAVDHALVVDGMRLPGKRSWRRHWEVLRNATDFTGLRVLDLGCTMGLLPTWLLKEAGARSALGVDADPLMLASARQVAEAFSADACFEKIDLDADYPWESRFGPADFDVVFVLGTLDRVRDRRRLMRFLGRFPMVVFEGRGQDEAAIRRFAAAGFHVHRVLAAADRGRTVLVFSR